MNCAGVHFYVAHPLTPRSETSIRGEIEDVGVRPHHQVAEAEHLALSGEEDGAVGGFAGHQFSLDQG